MIDDEEHQQHRTSIDNSLKLDRILSWIEGDSTNPGFNDRIKLIEKILFGQEGKRGVIQEHMIMWRIHVWLLCALSGLLGSIITLMVEKIIKSVA